jgi:hypothetical protein
MASFSRVLSRAMKATTFSSWNVMPMVEINMDKKDGSRARLAQEKFFQGNLLMPGGKLFSSQGGPST